MRQFTLMQLLVVVAVIASGIALLSRSMSLSQEDGALGIWMLSGIVLGGVIGWFFKHPILALC
jgi:hypothetical protein